MYLKLGDHGNAASLPLMIRRTMMIAVSER